MSIRIENTDEDGARTWQTLTLDHTADEAELTLLERRDSLWRCSADGRWNADGTVRPWVALSGPCTIYEDPF